MPIDALLNAGLHKLKRTRDGHWIARCPAHEDKSPSLSITLLADGRVLIKCFAECGAADVLGALGLDMSALYPDSPGDLAPLTSKRRYAFDVLQTVRNEVLLAWMTIARASNGHAIDAEGIAQLTLAACRLDEAYEYARGEARSPASRAALEWMANERRRK